MRGNIRWSLQEDNGAPSKRARPTAALLPRGQQPDPEDFPRPDPRLCPRDEAIFLLHTAAEIEHSLMVQYLYAAMTLNTEDRHAAKWQRIILGIAKEEMGHFITVQNLLRLIGGPLNFEREDTPFRSEYYPFRFCLNPLRIEPPNGDWEKAGNLNRYIAAEMPPLDKIEEKDRKDVRQILGYRDEKKFRDDTATLRKVNRVGRLYARLIEVFEKELRDEDFLDAKDIDGYLADAKTWDRAGDDFTVLVMPTRNRAEAIEALIEIAEQGEGEGPKTDEASHFQKFLVVYREFRDQLAKDPKYTPALPVPDEPTTAAVPDTESLRQEHAARGWTHITHPQARRWVQLFDLRYRVTLGLIMHQMLLNGDPDKPDTVMARTALANAAISEMHTLGWLARAIVLRPLTPKAGEKLRAAPAFELPYTFAFPDREADRARVHLMVLEASDRLVAKIRENHAAEPIPQDKKNEEVELLNWMLLRDLSLKRLCESIQKATRDEHKDEEESDASEDAEQPA